jgi:hypothetical protein
LLFVLYIRARLVGRGFTPASTHPQAFKNQPTRQSRDQVLVVILSVVEGPEFALCALYQGTTGRPGIYPRHQPIQKFLKINPRDEVAIKPCPFSQTRVSS